LGDYQVNPGVPPLPLALPTSALPIPIPIALPTPVAADTTKVIFAGMAEGDGIRSRGIEGCGCVPRIA